MGIFINHKLIEIRVFVQYFKYVKLNIIYFIDPVIAVAVSKLCKLVLSQDYNPFGIQ